MKHIIFDDYNTLLPGIVHNIICLTNDIKADTGQDGKSDHPLKVKNVSVRKTSVDFMGVGAGTIRNRPSLRATLSCYGRSDSLSNPVLAFSGKCARESCHTETGHCGIIQKDCHGCQKSSQPMARFMLETPKVTFRGMTFDSKVNLAIREC